ncbi:MAG: hypothetical protein WAW92_03255 [Minisyncoccia bacterium]
MKILIATGIYPPDIGGPSEYAKNLEENWQNLGHEVRVSVFSRWNFLPTGLRHLIYLLSIIPPILRSDFVVTLDTFSSALPATIVSIVLRKKIIVRTGGDFLWEWYVERTGDMIFLRDFYSSLDGKLNLKEKIIFNITKFVLNNVNAVIWSTEFQKNIFFKPYILEHQRHFIVENYYGQKVSGQDYKDKNFIAASRSAKLKNLDLLKDVFENDKLKKIGVYLDSTQVSHKELISKIESSYAVILASISEISPNTINDAIRHGKPFIVTKEVGIYDRIKDIALFIDPKSKIDIEQKVLWLCDPKNYELQKSKVESFNFVHTWEDIAKEYINIFNVIK